MKKSYRFIDRPINQNDLCDRRSYAIIEWKDLLTGLSYLSHPGIIKSAIEDVELFERHLPKDIVKLTVKPISNTFEELNNDSGYLESEYRPNTFNTHLQINSREIDEEKKYSNMLYNTKCDTIYRESLNNPETRELFKICGSMCHRGFVNSIFDYQHQSDSEMEKLREYVKIIGEDKNQVLENIKKLSDIRPTSLSNSSEEFNREIGISWSSSIYRNGFYTKYVRMICLYCEQMFGFSKYIVATHFEKEDPNLFLKYAEEYPKKNPQKSAPEITVRYVLFKAGYIYAEKGDYAMALSIFEKGISVAKCSSRIFDQKIVKFKEYYKTNGTTILSSDY